MSREFSYLRLMRASINTIFDICTDTIFLYQIISWKDLENPFRKDQRTHLVFLPTLLRWKGAQRLDGSQAANPDLVSMLLEDED